MPSVGISILSLLVNVAGLVFLVVAYFSMANSVRRELPKYGVPVSIGGVTLFFFTYLYFQGQLRWFSRWREGDRNDGKPPKGIFWLLMSIVFIGAIMLAIAFPTYLDYVKRSQTLAAQSSQLSGENAANTIPNVATDYSNPPSTNTEGQAVSSMPSVQDEAEAIARAATEADTGATLAADTTEMGTDPTLEEAVPDPYAAYRAEQEAKRNAELLATKARVDWINTCATRSRTLATPAGSEIGLNAQEATHYCECVHDAQSGSEAGLAQGKCLDRLMQSAD
jgi:Tfp pilus assembly protein PilE